MLKNGIYEQIVNTRINKELQQLDREKYDIELEKLDGEDARRILTIYISYVINQALQYLRDSFPSSKENESLLAQIRLCNEIVQEIAEHTNEPEFEDNIILEKGEVLTSLYEKMNSARSINTIKAVHPETSIVENALFTGSKNEPSMLSELKKEILSSDSIDLLVSFIKWSAIRPLLVELTAFTKREGVRLRVIATTYTQATDYKAIVALAELPNTEVKINYETNHARMHAKSYLFKRDTGFSTAYIGSSNLSNPALTGGLEWNVKVTEKESFDIVKKFSVSFESYWNDASFETFDPENPDCHEKLKKELTRAAFDRKSKRSLQVSIRPYAYQQEILDNLAAEREVYGHYRNLVSAATGVGKTIIAAFDYKAFKEKNPRARLLFVAHRKEILEQSIQKFQEVLNDFNFGELYVDGYKPTDIEHLFISIQSFNSAKLSQWTSKDYYDFIIVDEFHHAAADSYQELLAYYEPKILLGLTATPDRMDGKDILKYFDGRIASKLLLGEAIDRNLLSPFQYLGVTDDTDYRNFKWTRGKYDVSELEKVYTADTRRCALILNSVKKYVTDISSVKGLGFCVSVAHANYMAKYFNDKGIPSIALSSKSADDIRNDAKTDLLSGKINFIFVVDLYNEGVDIPAIDTVLFLRPTESATVFLQQLGRGLRLSPGKDCLTVLDFIGQANKKYNFEDKFAALLSNSTRGVTREIKDGFISLPKGCYIQLEKKAARYILDNIRASYGNSAGLVARIATFEEDTGLKLTLENFLDHYRLDPRSIYKFASFSRLCARADIIDNFEEPMEEVMSKALSRFALVDSRRWIVFMLRVLENIDHFDLTKLSDIEKRMLQMFYITMWGKAIEDWNADEVFENFRALLNSPVMLSELIALLKYNYTRIDFIDEPVRLGFDCPLDLHCTYTRDQLLVAMDFMKPSTVREGVKWLPDKEIDVFFITLNKSDKDYSPTTMYKDYSINETLFHWQSQSTTNTEGKVGQRYIRHRRNGSKVLLFVREFKNDVYGNTAPYTYLGTANYISHNGSRPMNITWRLDAPIPAKYLKKTNKLVVG